VCAESIAGALARHVGQPDRREERRDRAGHPLDLRPWCGCLDKVIGAGCRLRIECYEAISKEIGREDPGEGFASGQRGRCGLREQRAAE